MVIHKYRMEIEDNFQVEIPQDFSPLHIGIDPKDGNLYLWASVDTNSEMTHKTFYCRGTGHIEPIAKYIGTVPMDNGFVWHFFMEIPTMR